MSDFPTIEPKELVSTELELDDDVLSFLEIIKKDMKKPLNEDYYSCFINTVIRVRMIKKSDPLYYFFESTEELCNILQLIPKIGEIKNKIINQELIEPTEQILSTRRKINTLYNSIMLKQRHLDYSENQELSGRSISNEVIIFIFLKIITNIEVYLEDRLKNTLGSNKVFFDNFIKNSKDDMPTRWHNGEKIYPYDYYTGMDEIVFKNMLLFPYHEISGRTNHIYRKAFNLDLMTYPQKEDLIKMIKTRHKIIHRGCKDLSSECNFTLESVENYIKLSYNFVCWVENNLAEYDLRAAYNKKYSKNEEIRSL